VTELGRSVDPFELDLLKCLAGCVREHGFSESDDSLLDTWNGALEENEVVLDLTVADKATHWCDLLVDNIEVGGGVLLVLALANTVDLVVDGSTVVVTHLTSTGNSPLDVGRMPCTNTSDLSQTLVCLSGQLLGSPSAGDTLETVTLGDGNGINHLILLEDGIDLNWLLKQTMAEVDLVRNASTVDLDLHQVRLLLLERC